MKNFEDMYGMEACMESVEFYVEHLHKNPFEELGRSIIRAEQDPFFNRTMIKAYETYILKNNIRWDDSKK